MRIPFPCLALAVVALLLTGPRAYSKEKKHMSDEKLYSFTLNDIDGKPKALKDYHGKVLLLVNVASKCGNTPQYEALEQLYDKYKAKGFEVLGFPANDFGHQEPGNEQQIKEFCSTKYHVDFPMFSKIVVKGADKNPLYKYLTEETPFKGEVEWNFGKFLADRNGRIIARFSPKTKPESKEVTDAIEKSLQ